MGISIKAELVNKNISNREVAEKLGIHPNTLTHKLEGRTAFTIDEAFKIKENFLPDIDLKCFSRMNATDLNKAG